MQTLVAATNPSRSPNAAEVLRSGLARGEIQCIAACTPSGYRALVEAAPWIGDLFRAVQVRSLDEGETLRVLQARKGRYEKFHAVTYSDEALECAARCSGRFRPEESLPGKAIELLDGAGTRVKLRQAAPPEEIAEVQKRIKFIVHRMDSAIANHEFEKARFYSEEEKKERENLRLLQEKYKPDDSSMSVVSRQDVEETIERWGEYPFRP
jgi:ATP-dependent Clp protease ATP-binding subunit ClpC